MSAVLSSLTQYEDCEVYTMLISDQAIVLWINQLIFYSTLLINAAEIKFFFNILLFELCEVISLYLFWQVSENVKSWWENNEVKEIMSNWMKN